MGVLTGLGPTDGGAGEDDDKGTHASRRTTKGRKVGFHVAMAGKSTRATWPRRPTPSYADDCFVAPVVSSPFALGHVCVGGGRDVSSKRSWSASCVI